MTFALGMSCPGEFDTKVDLERFFCQSLQCLCFSKSCLALAFFLLISPLTKQGAGQRKESSQLIGGLFTALGKYFWEGNLSCWFK